MKRGFIRWPALLGIAVAAFLVLQVIPYGAARTNPPVVAEPRWDSPVTQDLARRACYDCHSNETEWPAYSRVAPASWLVSRHVVEGRAVLNFSEWQRPQKEAKEAAEKVLEGEMPLRSYTLVHGHARLTDAERTTLAQGLTMTMGRAVREVDERMERRLP